MTAVAATRRLPVSVVIAAYNQRDHLERALLSVLSQRPYGPAEIVVVDDHSTDGSDEVAASLGARVIRLSRNQGTSSARNTGIEAALQPWIAFLDHDDEWLPHHLGTLWQLRDGHQLIAGSALWCGRDPRKDRLHGLLSDEPIVLRSPARLIYPGNLIPQSATLVRRAALTELGGFRHAHGAADLDLWIRVVERGTGVLSPTVTVLYHVHEKQASRDVQMMQRGHISVAESYAGRPWWSPRLVERWRGTAAWNNCRSAIRRGHLVEAARHAATIAADPQRMWGAAAGWAWRVRLRRRSAAVARDGGPSVAVLRGGDKLPDGALPGHDRRNLVDLTHVSLARAFVTLARRPTASAYIGSTVQARALNLLGVRTIQAGETDP